MTGKDRRGPAGRRPERDVVLGLVRAAAGGPAVDADSVRATDPVILMETLARARAVTTLGALLLRQHPRAVPAWFADRVGGSLDLARRTGLLHHGVTVRVSAALAERSIPAMPLKGAVLAEAVHGDLGARISSDIDLLVDPAQMDAAVATLAELGWREPVRAAPEGELPRLHRVMEHDTLPPVELHWRVHWYEERYSSEVLDRATSARDTGLLRPQPADELVFLLLFLARDGFVGLRQLLDVAAWWRTLGSGSAPARAVAAVAGAHAALGPSLTASARWSEAMLGLPTGTLLADPAPLTRAQRTALRLANPWADGSEEQVDAEVSLVDGLLAPPGAAGAFVRRWIVPSADEARTRQPALRTAGLARLRAAQLAHTVRVLGRYLLATQRLIGFRQP